MMPTATLAYDLSDPDEEREHRYALAGRDALIVLERIDGHIRGILKHGDPSEETRRALEEIRAMVPCELTELLA